MPISFLNRRRFITVTTLASFASSPLLTHAATKRRVAIIGHTGRGNYGHGLDKVWKLIPDAEIVAIADADPAGLQKALTRLDVKTGFEDYREMLYQTKPEFVSVAPRHADQHHDMVLAAIASEARGIYVEKPFCRTPGEADSIISAATRHNTKIAVAHRNRYHPTLPVIKKLIADGKIGRLLELRGHGGGDKRGGGEDLWVLGGHIFNLVDYFAGAPTSCTATILQDGRRATAQDIRIGAEGLGPILGNEIHARFLMQNGVTASYTTFTNDDSKKTSYALQILGTKGRISIHIDKRPLAWLTEGNPFNPSTRNNPRIPIHSHGLGGEEKNTNLIQRVQNHAVAVEDLITSVDKDRNPICDASQATTTIEMTCAAFASHMHNSTSIILPQKNRSHPLAR